MDVDQKIGGTVGLSVDEQSVEAALAVDDVAEQAPAHPPVAEGRMAEQAHGVEFVLPRRPFLPVTVVGQMRWKLGAAHEGEGRADVLRRDLPAVIGSDFRPLARPPGRSDSEIEIVADIATWKIDEAVE